MEDIDPREKLCMMGNLNGWVENRAVMGRHGVPSVNDNSERVHGIVSVRRNECSK